MVVDPDSKKLILAHQSPSGAVSVKAHQVDVQERRTPHDTEFVLETWPAGPDRAAGHDKIGRRRSTFLPCYVLTYGKRHKQEELILS